VELLYIKYNMEYASEDNKSYYFKYDKNGAHIDECEKVMERGYSASDYEQINNRKRMRMYALTNMQRNMKTCKNKYGKENNKYNRKNNKHCKRAEYMETDNESDENIEDRGEKMRTILAALRKGMVMTNSVKLMRKLLPYMDEIKVNDILAMQVTYIIFNMEKHKAWSWDSNTPSTSVKCCKLYEKISIKIHIHDEI
jgi:hypothetical protein